MATQDDETDVVIIGAGPVGLFAVFECGMLRMRCHLIDVLDEVGGQCSALYPEKPIYDIPGYPEIAAGDLITKLTEQAAPFKPVFHLGQQVTALTADGSGGWTIETSSGTRLRTKAVIIAAGVGAFGPNRPPLAGIEAFEGQPPGSGVHYFVKQRDAYHGKRVVIAGGGDSAVDWALSLSEVAAHIAVVHRRAKFRAAPESAERLRRLAESGRIDLVVPYQLHTLEGVGDTLTGVVVADLDDNKRILPADALLPFFGLSQNLGPIAEWGLNMERNLISVDPSTCMTSQSGICAIGDIVTYPGKLKLILTGFAEAAAAAHALFGVVHPGEALHFEYSTTKGVQGFPQETATH